MTIRAIERIVGGLCLAAVLAFIAFSISWRVDGGRWENVETPSMGEVAPVGSLLWIKPVDVDQLEVGDFITFHPPGESSVTYSHRVYAINPDGTITTKGVIPGPDPWHLTAADVVGSVRMNWWGVGWLVVAAPILIVGGLMVGGARALAKDRWKLPLTLVFGSLVVSVAIVAHKPFVNAEQLAFAPSDGGGADATYVGTGLLPIRVQAHDGGHVDLGAGHVGTVHVAKVDSKDRLRVYLTPAVPFWFWIALVGACFLPALCSALIGSRGRRRQPMPA
jgi:hypothetical protein